MKIRRNQLRDRRTTRLLREDGWSVVRVWECVLSKKAEQCLRTIQRALAKASTMSSKSR